MQLHYRKLGQGKPLVILHGLFGSADNWLSLAKFLAKKYEVYLVDQRNHGHSPHSDEFSYQIMADDLLEIVQNENLSEINLVGHSMGGKTAIVFTQQNPELVSKLVIVDMGVKQYPPHHQLILKALTTIDLNNFDRRGPIENAMAQYITETSVRQFLLKNIYRSDKNTFAWRINIPVLESKMDEVLGALPTTAVENETLFIRGKKSNYILESDYTSIKAQFPQSHIVSLNCGHWVHAEVPEEFYTELVNFVG